MSEISVKQRAKAFTGVMMDDVDEALHLIRRVKPKRNLKQMLERETVLEKLNKRGRTTYGLDQEPGSGMSVNLFIGMPDPQPQPEQPAIDVEVNAS